MNAPRTPHPALPTQDARLGHLHATLRSAQVRLRLREAVRLIPIAGALGVGATLALALIWRLRDELSLLTLLGVGSLLVCAAILTTFLYAWLRPRDQMHTARMADHLLSLDERLATALEASTKMPENPTPVQLELRSAQLDDALTSAKSISIRHALPLKVEGRRLAPVGLLIMLLALVVVAPNPFYNIDRAVQGQIAQEQKKIQRIEEAVKAAPRLAQDPALQELLKELSDLSRDLSAGDLKREEALARLSDAESKLQKVLDSQARSQRAALDELAKQLAGSESAAAKQAGEALKSGDAQKAADALKQAGADVAKMSPEERKALADALKQARDNLSALNPEMARRLSDAAEALSGSDPQAAQKSLEALGQQIVDTEQKLATQQQISQALAQLQQSKRNIAQAGQGQPTSQPGSGTAIANGTAGAIGTAIALGQITPQPGNGTAQAGTPIALGSPVSGTPGAGGTAVAIPGQGQGQTGGPQGGQQGGNQGNLPGQEGTGGQGGNQSWGTGHQEPVYAPPSSLSATLTPVVVQGKPNPGGEQGTAPINGGTTTGEAQVPYEQVYAQYLEQAGTALGSDYIPQGYKDLVRDYFSELEPGR
ncbi:MAG TPA: hypothetical protein VJ183_04085 [Chloroflexia bacterium]|nr:hypothetical protein [Chloroflexia bacterium]